MADQGEDGENSRNNDQLTGKFPVAAHTLCHGEGTGGNRCGKNRKEVNSIMGT